MSIYGKTVLYNKYVDVFFFQTLAKCGRIIKDNLIHISKSKVRGSSYKAPWGVPVLDGDYSWCPNDSDTHPYLDIEFGEFSSIEM